jgi:hypothetical protein
MWQVMGEMRGACSILVGKPDGRGPLGCPWCKWEVSIKMYLREVGWGMDWLRIWTGGWLL